MTQCAYRGDAIHKPPVYLWF